MRRVPYNKLLTNLACSSRTGEYWPSVAFVRTSRCSVRTVKTSGQYSPVRPSRSVSKRLIFPNFQNFARCEKDLKDNKDNSRHLGRKYARIFVLGHYLFLVAHSFPRASLSENCSLLGTDNVRGQISLHIFAPNDDYCLYNPLDFVSGIIRQYSLRLRRIIVKYSLIRRQGQ